MTDHVFYRFSPVIRDYIYKNAWEELRGIQLAAAQVLFHTDNNLILTSKTASGKTEAAFFPIISMMEEDMPRSVGVLYIAPLKSLINDQFQRIDEILEESEIPVFHWHGDVSASHKNKLLKNPRGILQITPESLESMLINRANDIPRLFCDLRFVIIDEIHVLCGSDRGNQIICQLERISRLIGRDIRRVGLSATVRDTAGAVRWLSGNSGRACSVPTLEEGKVSWRLAMSHFYVQDSGYCAESMDNDAQQAPQKEFSPTPSLEKSIGETSSLSVSDCRQRRAALDAGYEYIYDCVRNKKSLVFSNSREETEYLTATLRQIARLRNEPDIFLIHHGNLSAAIREEAEAKMKDDDAQAVACATVTMELGIDIGRLERVVQSDAPNSVSSFLQRLGRSGRRGAPPEMFMVFREENPLPNTPLPQLFPWGLLRAIAIVQLYIEERFIEPPHAKKYPFSLLFHQTLSILAASGDLTPKALADRVLSLPAFRNIKREDYKTLIVSMLKNDFLEMTEEKTLLIGLAGERFTGSFKFYAVFKDSEDYSVKCDSEEIGTITTPPPVGDRFALAGRVWEVTEVDMGRKLIYVKAVEGKMEISWPGDYGEIHTKILKRMQRVLQEETEYPYLKENAQKRLADARRTARNAGCDSRNLVQLGAMSFCLFPWLGTVSFRTLRKLLTQHAKQLQISNIEFEGCYYITFRYAGEDRKQLGENIRRLMEAHIDKESLISPSETPVFEKYDAYIPRELLCRAYAEDKLRSDEINELAKYFKF